MKRKIFSLAIVLVLTITMSVSAYGYVWYSDSEFVRFFADTPTVRLTKIQTTTSFTGDTVRGWISDAVTKWSTDNTYPIPSTYVYDGNTSSTDVDIIVYAGKLDYISELCGIDLISSSGTVVNGRTVSTSSIYDTVTINGETKSVKKATKAIIYFVNKFSAGTYTSSSGTTVSFNSRSAVGMQNTIAHELGHALGYGGHSTLSSDLMTPSTSNTELMSITTRDRTQIGQFWKVYSSACSGLGSVTSSDDNEEAISYYYSLLSSNDTKAESIEFLENTVSYVDNVIVATPIEITQGSSEVLSEDVEDCEYLLTEYTFKVSNYLYGEEGEDYITVRSQVGNLFELGKEYTFATRRINNTLYDIYTVNSRKWVIDNEYLTSTDIASLSAAFSTAQDERLLTATSTERVIEVAEPTDSYVSYNVNLAIVATVTDAVVDDTDPIYTVSLGDIAVLKGTMSDGEYSNVIRIKGDVEIGETYLMLLNSNEDGCVMMSSKTGSIVNTTSDEFDAYLNIFEELS